MLLSEIQSFEILQKEISFSPNTSQFLCTNYLQGAEMGIESLLLVENNENLEDNIDFSCFSVDFIKTLSNSNHFEYFQQLKEGNKEIQSISFIFDEDVNKISNDNSLWIQIPVCFANIIENLFVFYPNGNTSMPSYYITTSYNQLICFEEFSLLSVTSFPQTEKIKNLFVFFFCLFFFFLTLM